MSNSTPAPDPRDAAPTEIADLRARLAASEAENAGLRLENAGLRADRDTSEAATMAIARGARKVALHGYEVGDSDRYTNIRIRECEVQAVLAATLEHAPGVLRPARFPVPKPSERRAS